MKKITVIGTGYVGLVSGTCFAEAGNAVTCVDIDETKIKKLREGIIPIYEPGLEELVKKNQETGRLNFTTSVEKGVKDSEIIFIAVGTPSDYDGQADLKYVKKVAKQIGVAINGYKIIVTKSTVPVGTGKIVQQLVNETSKGMYKFDVVSCPEFLREGSALHDTFHMDRVIIGATSERAATVLEELHKPFTSNVVKTKVETAEMIKYASNAFLATKISFINEVANICERVGADVMDVAKGMGFDKRIGDKFLNAGIGYGGSCFPKDTRALIKIAENAFYDFKIVKAVEEVNKKQKLKIVDLLEKELGELKGKKIGVLGLAFKPNTDDIREAPSLVIIPELVKREAIVKAYDPIATEEAQKYLDETNYVNFCRNKEEVLKNIDALVLLTEWDEFKNISLECLDEQKLFIDGRNLFYSQRQSFKNVKYIGIGIYDSTEENKTLYSSDLTSWEIDSQKQVVI
jgi:UDPglucose 6-dehydrogenase